MLCGFFCIGGTFPGLQAQAVLTLDSCRAMALRNNKDLKIAHEKVNSAYWWVLIIIFFEILIPPEPFMRDAPHFFYRKYNKNLL